jgi:hypothetical protein
MADNGNNVLDGLYSLAKSLPNKKAQAKAYLTTIIGTIASATTAAWADITGKPLVFPPAAHTHTTTDIIGLNEGLVGTKGVDEVAIGDDKILVYKTISNNLVYEAKPSGSGGITVTNFATYQDLINDVTVTSGNYGTVTNLLNSIFFKLTDWYALGRKIIWKVTANTKWYLALEDNTNDSSGNGYNAVATDVTYITGKVGAKAGNFNGTTSKAIYLGNPIGTTIINLTMMCWVYLSGTSLKGIFLDVGSNPDANGFNIKGFAIGVGTTTTDSVGNNLIGVYNGIRWIPSGKAIGTGWHHIAMAINGTSKPILYLDGVQVYADASTNPSALTTTTPNMVIGATYNNRFFNGYIDEVIFESRLWTSQEIFEYYMQTQ